MRPLKLKLSFSAVCLSCFERLQKGSTIIEVSPSVVIKEYKMILLPIFIPKEINNGYLVPRPQFFDRSSGIFAHSRKAGERKSNGEVKFES